MPATLTEPARPLDLLNAVERAGRLARRGLEAPAGRSWREIAEHQTALANECLEVLNELLEALAPTPSR